MKHRGPPIWPRWWVKIADFGLTKRIDDTELRTAVGTLAYCAPEIRDVYPPDFEDGDEKTFSLAVDIWSIGAITVRIISGQLAFPPGSRTLSGYVANGKEFPQEYLRSLDEESTPFVLKTMAASPRHRPTAREGLALSWVADTAKHSEMYVLILSVALSDDRCCNADF